MGLQQQLLYILLLFGGKQICSNGQFKIQSNFYNALIHANNALMPPNRHALIHPNVNEPENLQVSSRSLKAEAEMDDLPPIITQPLLPNKNDRDFEPLSGIMVKGPCQWEIQTSYNPTRIPTQITEVICTGTGTSCEQNHPMYQCTQMLSRMEVAYISHNENEMYYVRNITVGTACTCMYQEMNTIDSFMEMILE